MALYRGMQIPDHLCAVIPHMAMVDECRESLQILTQQWDLLDVLSRVIKTGTEVKRTRSDFRALTRDLVAALGDETLRTVTAAIGAKAQVTVDIIVRNLFERTADIGFLATDDDIRAFLIQEAGHDTASIRQRLIEYRAKYSVYDDIIVLDADGRVRATCDREITGLRCTDALVADALSTDEAYVEHYAVSDMAPAGEKVLTYSYRIQASGEPTAKTIGVLSLLFGFDTEMQGIFEKLAGENDWAVMTVLDESGQVLASSDPAQIAVGTRLRADPTRDYQLMRHGGRRYIAATRATKGYQGYTGPGWTGCALLPVDCAFEGDASDSAAATLPDDWYRAIAANTALFSDPVRDIPQRAVAIQSELDRTVWNGGLVGSLTGDTSSSATHDHVARQTLLAEISETGCQTGAIFASAVTALNRTAVGSLLTDCAFAASLGLDIMDRNLYERANDCRWWALTSRFRTILAGKTITSAQRDELTATLRMINDLYTVYTNLILFDAHGEIIAVSDTDASDLIGTPVDAELAHRFTQRPETSVYGVSDFSASPLYGDKPTYIYGAPVLDIHNDKRIVGGIAIVFDSEPQFMAMLEDALPHNAEGQVLSGAQGVIMDATGVIITRVSDGPALPVTAIPPALLKIEPGDAISQVVEYGGQLYAVGVARSSGYREYKSATDAYQNDVFCICAVTLGSIDIVKNKMTAPAMPRPHAQQSGQKPRMDVATFRIGDSWIGVELDRAVEAVTLDRMVKAPAQGSEIAGYALYRNQSIVVLDLAKRFSDGSPVSADDTRIAPSPAAKTVVILRDSNDNLIGVQVDGLGDVISVDTDRATTPCLAAHQHMIKAVLAPDDAAANSDTMLLIVDTDRIGRPPPIEAGFSPIDVAA